MAIVGLPFNRWENYPLIPIDVNKLNKQRRIGKINSRIQLVHAINLYDTYDGFLAHRISETDEYFIKVTLLDDMLESINFELLLKNKVFLTKLKNLINEQKKLIQRFRD